MSKLNINRNIFLGAEELLRFQDFLVDDPASNVFLGNTTQFGVIKTDFVTDLDFLVQVGTNVGTIKISALSKAIDINKKLIYQEAIDNISVTQDSNYYWVKISHAYRRYEVGNVSVDVDGNLVGTGTLFSEILRGQSTRVPTRIKFYKETGTLLNTGTYEVLGVTDDLSCVLQGDFIAETGLKYIILGSVAIGETITSQIEEGLYKYDSCLIEFIAEEVEDTAPTTGFTEDEEFYIARVKNTAGTVTIEDKRQFWLFNIVGLEDKLDKEPSNWSLDSTQQASARGKLDIYSTDEVNDLVNATEVDWQSMTRGAGCVSSGYDIKIARIGKILYISGTFQTILNPSEGTLIASIAQSALGTGIKLNNRIYHQINSIDTVSSGENRGVKIYVETISVASSDLQIKVGATANDNPECYFNIAVPLI